MRLGIAMSMPWVLGALLAQPAKPARESVGSPIARPNVEPAFEVASIKRADPNEPGEGLGWKQGGRLVATCLNVRHLIGQAYGVFDFQVSAGPHWIDSDPFDINAKPAAETAAAIQNLGDPSARKSALNAMFQNLLADRFRLQVSRETRELPVYELVVGKGGSKLKENTTPGDVSGGGGGDSAHIRVTGTRTTLTWLVENLSGALQRPIIDRTGLAGKYDYSLEWAPDQTNGTGPSVFTALQEQLGLKLESSKGPVEILVINRVERPTEN